MLAYDFDMLERVETTNQRPAYLVDFIYAFQAQTNNPSSWGAQASCFGALFY